MTIKEIARRCGVSRGTVDRVINGRGKVHPDTEALIIRTLEEVGYTKNIVGRALTVRRTSPIIGVVLSSEGNPFFDEVIEGIRKAEAELSDYGVTVHLRTMRGYAPQEQLDLIEGLQEGLSALVLHPINDACITERVAALAEHSIPTVTVNSDLEHSARRCYVGSDYAEGGRMAAGILRLATGGQACLGIITGVETILGHVQRLEGFEAHLRAACPGIAIASRASAQDDDEHAYAATKRMLQDNQGIDTLLVVAAGVEGVCRAVIDLGLDGRISIFTFDNIPTTDAMIRRGLIKATINQQPYQQGYQAVKAAFDIILAGATEERHILENHIRILENLPL